MSYVNVDEYYHRKFKVDVAKIIDIHIHICLQLWLIVSFIQKILNLMLVKLFELDMAQIIRSYVCW